MVFVVGFTLIVLPLAPVLQEYVVAPDAVNTVELPVHIVALFTDTEGKEFTLTVDVTVLEQPVIEDVPVTTYVVLVIGLTLIVLPVALVLQE